MADRTMTEKSFSLIALLFALLLSACSGPQAEPPLQGASLGGPFTLTTHEGRRMSSDELAGKYRLVYFGFTFCPDVCPTDLQTIGAAMRQFEEKNPQQAERVRPIFITVDPVRDTPEVMRRYTSNFHPRILGLTGSEEEIAQVARAHGIHFSRAPASESGDYLVDHARMIVLYGPQGEPIAIVPHDQGPAAVVAALERWVA